MKKVVAYLTTPGGLTGAPRRLLALASGLRQQGIAVCIASQSGSELLEAAATAGHETAAVDATGVLALRQGALFGGGLWFRLRVLCALMRQNLRLLGCIRARNGDVVWIRGSKGIAFGALGALLSRRPLIWDVDYELPSKGMVRWLHRFGLWMSRVVVFQYRAAPAEIFGERLSNRYKEKFPTIVPGIELKSLRHLATRRRKQVLAKDGLFVILHIGTICERKNQALTIEALRQAGLDSLGKNWELWLAYDEIQNPELSERVQEYGLVQNVKFLGWRDDVKALMAQASLLVMPSRDEGVPNAVQEAMAIGLPVLVSGAGGLPEIVEDGETGWVLRTEDAEAWATRIRWCYDNREACDEIGRRASTYAFEHFGTEHWAAQYARIICDAVSSVGKQRDD